MTPPPLALHLPPDVSLWRVDVRAHADRPARTLQAEAIRSRLGVALHRRVCALDCGEGRCRLPASCAFAACFEGDDSVRPWRIDTSEIDGATVRAGAAWSLRVATFARAHEAPLLAALRDALAPDRVERLVPLADGGDAAAPRPAEAPMDLGLRATELTGPTVVSARSPLSLKRKAPGEARSRPVDDPTVLDLLHATLQRARRIGVDVAAWPRFGADVRLLEETAPERFRVVHLTRRQPTPGHLVGVRRSWLLRPTPEQAAWLALAEVIGVGGRTTMGMGVIRCSWL